MERSFTALRLAGIFCFGFLAATLPAQTRDTAAIHGRIPDQSRAPVAGVAVTVSSTLSILKRAAEADAQDEFTVTALPLDADYNITAMKTGFGPGKVTALTLESGAIAGIQLQLNVAAGSTQVTVTGVSGEIRTSVLARTRLRLP